MNATQDTTQWRDFVVTDGKGFQMRFPNGFIVSVQWGPHNYIDADRRWFSPNAPSDLRAWDSNTAEVAVMDSDYNFVRTPWADDDVMGHCDPARVLDVMNWAASQPA